MIMKKYSIVVIALFIILNSASAKLRNGYENDIRNIGDTLEHYRHLMIKNTDLSPMEKRIIKTSIKRLIALQSYYELT